MVLRERGGLIGNPKGMGWVLRLVLGCLGCSYDSSVVLRGWQGSHEWFEGGGLVFMSDPEAEGGVCLVGSPSWGEILTSGARVWARFF